MHFTILNQQGMMKSVLNSSISVENCIVGINTPSSAKKICILTVLNHLTLPMWSSYFTYSQPAQKQYESEHCFCLVCLVLQAKKIPNPPNHKVWLKANMWRVVNRAHGLCDTAKTDGSPVIILSCKNCTISYWATNYRGLHVQYEILLTRDGTVMPPSAARPLPSPFTSLSKCHHHPSHTLTKTHTNRLMLHPP